LLEDVILDGAGKLLRPHTLLLSGNDIQRHDWKHGAVHGHGYTHPVERYAIEEHSHVENAVYGDTCHSNVACHSRMVRVVPAVSRQVEGYAEPLLTGSEIAPVERIGFLCRGKARVLANGPRLANIHRGIGSAHEGRKARHGLQVQNRIERARVVHGLDVHAFRGLPYPGPCCRTSDCRWRPGNAGEVSTVTHPATSWDS